MTPTLRACLRVARTGRCFVLPTPQFICSRRFVFLVGCDYRYRYKWSVYSSPSEQWLLWDALDERGERECALKAAIKARFDIEEPEVVYELTGSEFVGRKVRRVFGKRVSKATVELRTLCIFTQA